MRGRIIDCCVTLKHNKLQLRNYITMFQSCQMPLWCSVSRNVGMLQEQSILFFSIYGVDRVDSCTLIARVL